LVSWKAEIKRHIDKNVNPLKYVKTSSLVVFVLVLLGSFFLATFSYRMLITIQQASAVSLTATPAIPVTSPTSIGTTTGTPATTYPSIVSPAAVLGIVADTQYPFEGIPWVRLGYGTCFGNVMKGDVLKTTVARYHSQGVRVMLSLCQWASDEQLFNMNILNDASQGAADAVQCGNEQMKQGPANRYVPPAIFAKFFDLCQHAMHAIRSDIPIIIGANDPHVGGIDYQPLVDQAHYLDKMQAAMNTSVHPGGNWQWRSQTIGLIDSWHNGYPSQATNSLNGLFAFWAQQFGVNLNNGGLGKHLWVIEGTGCIYGCGIDSSSAYVVAVSHILTLVTDVQTTMRYKVPFFYFSARDFASQGAYWPMGVRDGSGRAKPLRQDLPMGARTLNLSCASGSVKVSSQEQLIAKLYNGCKLPNDYISTLTS
jgi:hypothetical protein